jgi:hypothetical protein
VILDRKESSVTSYTGLFHCMPTSTTNPLEVCSLIVGVANRQQLCTIERDVGSLLQGTHLYGGYSKLGLCLLN